MINKDLVIDRDVRDWVLLPLTVTVFLLSLLRQYASVVCPVPTPVFPLTTHSQVVMPQFYV